MMAASGPAGCQGGDTAISARIDPLRASEADLSAEVERSVEGIDSARARMAARVELVDEIIAARGAAEGRLPAAGAPAAEWQRFYEYYAPLKAALLDEMIPADELTATAREQAEFFRTRMPSRDDERLAREAAVILGARVVDEEVAR